MSEYDTPTGGWKKGYKRVKGKLCIVIVFLAIVGVLALCDAVFLGVWFGTSNHIGSRGIQHRFCIEARGADEFGDNTNDPNGLAVGHIKVDEATGWVSWKINYQLSPECGLIQWHIHGPIGTESPNAVVFRDLPTLPFGPADQLDQNGTLKGHIELTEKELREFLKHPESFYLNFHSDSRVDHDKLEVVDKDHEDKKLKRYVGVQCHPSGAIRGALNKICPSPDHYSDDDDEHEKQKEEHEPVDKDYEDYHKELHENGYQSHEHYDTSNATSYESRLSATTVAIVFMIVITMVI